MLSAPIDYSKLGVCLTVGFLLCLLGGEGHFFYANRDWLTRDAVLADLVRDAAPFYRYEGSDFHLRAPLGMYMLPAAIGRVFGLVSAHLTLLSQNATLFGSMFYLSSRLAGARTLIFLATLIAFSGMDLVGDLAAQAASLKSGEIVATTLEWWSRAFAPGLMLQYSSMVTQIFWAPNHAAPGWFIALLVLLQVRQEIALSTFIACCASLVLWSPLAVLGAIPFLAFLILRRPLREILTAENICAAAIASSFLPIAFYLVAGYGAAAIGRQSASEGSGKINLLFLLIELPQALILLYAWRTVEHVDRSALVVAIATLCLLPLYAFGPSNDLVLRASIPALFLIAFSFARLVAAKAQDRGSFRAVILSVVVLSAATPALQIAQALVAPSFSISDCNMLTYWQSDEPMAFPGNYFLPVEKAPAWLIAHDGSRAAIRLEYRDCWPDHPFRAALRKDRE